MSVTNKYVKGLANFERNQVPPASERRTGSLNSFTFETFRHQPTNEYCGRVVNQGSHDSLQKFALHSPTHSLPYPHSHITPSHTHPQTDARKHPALTREYCTCWCTAVSGSWPCRASRGCRAATGRAPRGGAARSPPCAPAPHVTVRAGPRAAPGAGPCLPIENKQFSRYSLEQGASAAELSNPMENSHTIPRGRQYSPMGAMGGMKGNGGIIMNGGGTCGAVLPPAAAAPVAAPLVPAGAPPTPVPKPKHVNVKETTANRGRFFAAQFFAPGKCVIKRALQPWTQLQSQLQRLRSVLHWIHIVLCSLTSAASQTVASLHL